MQPHIDFMSIEHEWRMDLASAPDEWNGLAIQISIGPIPNSQLRYMSDVATISRESDGRCAISIFDRDGALVWKLPFRELLEKLVTADKNIDEEPMT